ncbi:MAG: class I SAM-dependent methyltransferase [Acidimicrobiia bacterium]|jgi:SAM-dependent methyltransferase
MGERTVSIGADDVLSASLFDVYDELLVPLVFQSYAEDLAGRMTGMGAGSILEIAAGTGAVTRTLADALPAEVAITATDLVPGMIERAGRVGTSRPVTWDVADVMSLPYESESFDVVVCQFGAMFFAPQAGAFAEVRRVLRPGGRFLFSVWDRLDANEFADVVCAVAKGMFPEDPPQFLEHTPYGYHDDAAIAADLRAGGFDAAPSVERMEHPSRAARAVEVATAFCAGTPMRNEIESRGPDALATTIAAMAAALAERFGAVDLEGRTRAVFVAAHR